MAVSQAFFNVGMSGMFSLAVPFDIALVSGVSYRIEAVNTIETLLKHALDVKNLVYLDNGLTEQDYLADLNNKVTIITLVAGSYPTIMVPSRYILTTPDQNIVPYYEPIIGVSLGLLPQALPLEHLQQQIAAVISDTIGVEVPTTDVKINALPLTSGIDAEEHKRLETIRINNIANRTTDRALYLQEVEKNRVLQQAYNDLSKIVVDSGLAVPAPPSL